jgi:hypothetical protein
MCLNMQKSADAKVLIGRMRICARARVIATGVAPVAFVPACIGVFWCGSLCVYQRDANETKMETKAIVFSPPSLWPALVSPLVVLGAAVALLVLRLVFGLIDKRIALAREHQEAIRLASQGTFVCVQRTLRSKSDRFD